VVSIDRFCSSVGVMEFFFFVRPLFWILLILPLLEPELLVMCERIGEALKMVHSA
jgi:hypothetical protein